MPMAPSLVVDPPLAAPPIHSLLTAFPPVPSEDRLEKWTGGFQFKPRPCPVPGLSNRRCDPGSPVENPGFCPPPANTDFIDYFPFMIETTTPDCYAHGWTEDDWRAMATSQLEEVTPLGLEYGFWTGRAQEPVNQYLAKTGSVDLTPTPGTPVCPEWALSALIQYLSTCGGGGRGVIHAAPMLVDDWAGNGHLGSDERRMWTTVKRNIVVPGGGYTGSGPGDVTPPDGQMWAYATGPVLTRVGKIELVPETMAEALDRKTNLLHFAARRMAAAYFDPCCWAGILVDVTGC